MFGHLKLARSVKSIIRRHLASCGLRRAEEPGLVGYIRSNPLEDHSNVIKNLSFETLLVTVARKRFQFVIEVLIKKEVPQDPNGGGQFRESEFRISAPLVHRLYIIQTSILTRH